VCCQCVFTGKKEQPKPNQIGSNNFLKEINKYKKTALSFSGLVSQKSDGFVLLRLTGFDDDSTLNNVKPWQSFSAKIRAKNTAPARQA